MFKLFVLLAVATLCALVYVGESKASNIQLRGDTDEQTFVGFRKARDATLSPPNLIFQSIQCNIDAGRLPPPSASGQRYLLMPMGVFK